MSELKSSKLKNSLRIRRIKTQTQFFFKWGKTGKSKEGKKYNLYTSGLIKKTLKGDYRRNNPLSVKSWLTVYFSLATWILIIVEPLQLPREK